jgi:predicted RND superfamily exporter protein
LSLDYNDAVKRLEGALVGPVQRDAAGKSLGNQSRTTCLVVFLTEQATRDNKTMRTAIERISQIATKECGIAVDTIHIGGPPVDNITIDVEGERTLMRLAGLSGIVGFGLSYWCFRSIKLTSIVFTVGVISAGMSLAIVFYYGIFEVFLLDIARPRMGTVDAILMSMPAVVYVLGLSGAIHIVNYYRDARRDHGLEGAAEMAASHGWLPCALAAFTTAVGLGSLYTSDILPIKKFGLFTAFGVLATVGVLFTILPVFLHRFPISDDLVRRQSGRNRAGRGRGEDESHLPLWARRLFGWVVGRPVLVCTIWLGVMGLFALGLPQIETSVQLLKLLDEDTDLIHDYAWLEKHLGNLVPMEIIFTMPTERCRTADEHAEADGQQYRLTMLERLNLMREVQRRIEVLPEISRVLSVATFAPESTQTSITAANSSANYAKNKILEEQRQLLLDGDYLRLEHKPGHPDQLTGRELWRVSARVAALGGGEDGEGVDYGQFVEQLSEVVGPVILAYQQRDRIVQQLHLAGKKLDGARLCILFRDSTETATPAEDSQQWELASLLRRSGVQAKGGISFYNLAKLEAPQQTASTSSQEEGSMQGQGREQETGPERSEQTATYRAGVIRALAQQDALILVTADDIPLDGVPMIENPVDGDPVVGQLVSDGLSVIQVPDIALVNSSAASPYAQGAWEAKKDGPRPIRAVYTGMIPLVYKTQHQLLISLRESIGWATVLIAMVMMVVLRSPLAGLISMIPNIFPIIIVFGALGWLGIKVDIGIMMTASVALGVAVDDTIHYLTWFRRGIAEGLSRVEATMLAYDRCATAMAQTTLIGGLGLAVFATSTFTPTQQFGYLMITMLATALVGDLLLLPALLASPLGCLFTGNAPQDSEATGTDPGGITERNLNEQEPGGQETDGRWPTPRDITPNDMSGAGVPADIDPEASQASKPETVPHTPAADLSTEITPDDSSSSEPSSSRNESPHSALHAKLRSLRRKHSNDSLSSP